MRLYTEYYCEKCDETFMDEEVFVNSLGETFCPSCATKIDEVNSYLDI